MRKLTPSPRDPRRAVFCDMGTATAAVRRPPTIPQIGREETLET